MFRFMLGLGLLCRLKRYFFFEEQSLHNCVLAELNTVKMKFRDKKVIAVCRMKQKKLCF